MFILYIFFSVLVFLLPLVGYKKYKMTTLYALAIGGIVNANFFHAGNNPIECFGLPFGLDSIIYTLFAFCVFLIYIKEGRKQGYLLAISSALAVVISAAIQLIADLFTKGFNIESLKVFFIFFVSAFATIVAIVILIELLEKIKGKLNQYLLLLISMILVSFVNTLIYYSVVIALNNPVSNISQLLLTSLLGKCIAIACCFLPFYLINKIHKEKNIQ